MKKILSTLICSLLILGLSYTSAAQVDIMNGLEKISGEFIKSWTQEDKKDEQPEKKEFHQNETKDLKNDTLYSGYFKVDTYGQDMFYTLFESRVNVTRDLDPLIIWIRGDPGCSVSGSFFHENSPYNFGVNETSGQPMLKINNISWNNFSNVLYLDTPVGTGYSFDRGLNPLRSWNVDQVASDFGHFIKQFFNFHDKFRGRETYIVG